MTITAEKVRALLEAATPGPWAVLDGGWRDYHGSPFNPWRVMHVIVPPDPGPPQVVGGHRVVAKEFIASLKDAGSPAAVAAVEARASLIAACPDIARAYLEAVERVEELEAENEGLRDDHDCTYKWQCAGMEIGERALQERIAALEEGLRKYGRHGNCPRSSLRQFSAFQRGEKVEDLPPCTCGLDALLRAATR